MRHPTEAGCSEVSHSEDRDHLWAEALDMRSRQPAAMRPVVLCCAEVLTPHVRCVGHKDKLRRAEGTVNRGAVNAPQSGRVKFAG